MRDERLRRFYVDKIKVDENACIIKGSEARHITKVLRMKPGDRLILMDGKGSRFKAIIKSITPREVFAVLESLLPEPPASPVKITLCQGLSKFQAMDYLIQKASELGVDCISPFFSERTVVRFDEDRFDNKMRRWREIAINSAKQCCSAVPAKIKLPISFRDLMAEWRGAEALKVVLWEDETSNDLKELIKHSSSIKSFVGIVGPEGGFTREEIKAACEAGFVSISMGNRILRTETAAIALVAIVQYELGDLGLQGRQC